jgi:hypothetical protein
MEANDPWPRKHSAFSKDFSDFSAKFGAACKKFAEGGKEDEIEKEHPGFSAAFSAFSTNFSNKMFGDMPMDTAAPMAATPAPVPAPGAPPPAVTAPDQMAAVMSAIDGLTKKMGALEAAKSDEQQKTAASMAAKFSAEATAIFEEEQYKRRVGRTVRERLIALHTPTAQQFSEGKAADGLVALRKDILTFPKQTNFSEGIDDRGLANGEANSPLILSTPEVQAALNSERMRRQGGSARKIAAQVLAEATK